MGGQATETAKMLYRAADVISGVQVMWVRTLVPKSYMLTMEIRTLWKSGSQPAFETASGDEELLRNFKEESDTATKRLLGFCSDGIASFMVENDKDPYDKRYISLGIPLLMISFDLPFEDKLVRIFTEAAHLSGLSLVNRAELRKA